MTTCVAKRWKHQVATERCFFSPFCVNQPWLRAKSCQNLSPSAVAWPEGSALKPFGSLFWVMLRGLRHRATRDTGAMAHGSHVRQLSPGLESQSSTVGVGPTVLVHSQV